MAAKDRAYLIETYTRLQESFSTLLLHPSSAVASKLTAAEHKYYTTLNFLAAFLRTALETSKSDPSPPTLSTIVTGITSAFPSQPPASSSLSGHHDDIFQSLTNPHPLSTLRDTALATKQAASFVIAFNTAENARDRTGKSNLHKDIITQAKTLESLVNKTLTEVKENAKQLKNALGQGGWLDTIAAWTFGSDKDDNGEDLNKDEDQLAQSVREVVGEAELEEWSGKLVESWIEGIKGLEQVRME